MSRYYDKRSKEALKMKVGNLVIVSSKNLRTRRPSKKLDHKMQDPFEIEKVVSPNAVMLKLPRRWRLHNMLQVSLLEPYHVSSKASRAPPDPERVRNKVMRWMLMSKKVNGRLARSWEVPTIRTAT